jgi:hypothetical protein
MIPASRCAHRSVNSPELLRPAVALATAALLALGGACSRGARAVRLPALSPGDEIYRISCDDSIQECRDEAGKVCAGHYEVLEATGAPLTPPRVTTAPGPASTGPRYQRSKWVGQMVVACSSATAGSIKAEPLQGDRTTDEARRARSTTAAEAERNLADGVPRDAARVAPERLCIPGVTQECLGPGACRGAQACLADGNGYGPCDCGNADSGQRGEPAKSPPAAPANDGPPSRSHR